MLVVINNNTMAVVAIADTMEVAIAWAETVPKTDDFSIIKPCDEDLKPYGTGTLARLYSKLSHLESPRDRLKRVAFFTPEALRAAVIEDLTNQAPTSTLPPDVKRVAHVPTNEENEMTKRKTPEEIAANKAARKAASKKAPAKTKTGKKASTKKIAVKKDSAKVPAKKKARTVNADQEVQNGMTRPKPESSGGKVWAVADELSKKAGGPPARKDVIAECVKCGMSGPGSSSYFQDWRRFHGLIEKQVDDNALKLRTRS